MSRLAVVGAGSMGAQIAQQAALHGVEVRLQDVNGEQLTRGAESNRTLLQRRVEKDRMTADEMEAALARVHKTTELTEAVADADIVIEAVVERLEAKLLVFAELGRLAPLTRSSPATLRPWASRSWPQPVVGLTAAATCTSSIRPW